jgi:hypothetical protein
LRGKCRLGGKQSGVCCLLGFVLGGKNINPALKSVAALVEVCVILAAVHFSDGVGDGVCS